MWARILSAAAGIWVMAAPAVLNSSASAATNDRIIGPVVASFSIIAMWQVTRSLRWLNLPLGVWLVMAPFALGYISTAAGWNSVGIGIVVAVLSFVPGSSKHRLGGGWPSLWRRQSTR
ncbi:MAG TPA: SPW repeat protein [Chthoniobacterales bacterium]|nr:SPW repeat protein [Chthoniobacterales bacterium]